MHASLGIGPQHEIPTSCHPFANAGCRCSIGVRLTLAFHLLEAGLEAAGFAAGVFAAEDFAAGAFAAGAFAAGAFVAVGFVVEAFAVAGLAAGAFAAGAFFVGGLLSASSAPAVVLEDDEAPGTGFLVPIGVRLTGAFLVAGFEGAAFAAGLDVELAAGVFVVAGFDAGLASAAGFAVDGFAAGFLAESATFPTGAFAAAAFLAGTGLPVVLLMVEFTVSLYPCACFSKPSPVSVTVLPYCLA